MSRKIKSKKKVGQRPREKSVTRPEESGNALNENANDYGGLPDRDLKKNLGGCG